MDKGTCVRHTEHAWRGAKYVGRYFINHRDYWDECDVYMGVYVYCRSHVNVHATGWCGVPNNNKISLNGKTFPDALSEAREAGYRIYGED